MRVFTLAILILLSPICATAAYGPCTVEQGYCPKIIQQMADAHPSGQFDTTRNAYSWPTPTGEVISVEFDWYSDRGLVITHAESRQTRRTTEEIFDIAQTLASTYWSKTASNVLTNGLAKKAYTSWMQNDVMHFAICRKGTCKDFFIENSYDRGVDRVSVMWTLGASPSVEKALGLPARQRTKR
jgi:hypothetical protein